LHRQNYSLYITGRDNNENGEFNLHETANRFLRRYSSCNDDIGGLLADHVDGKSDVHARNLGEDGSIHNTETINTANAELTVKNSHRIVVSTDRSSARSVMTPSLVLDELLQVLLGRDVGGRPDTLELAIKRDEIVEGRDTVRDTFVDSLEIFVATDALAEGVEDNLGSIARVGRSQVDGTSIVARVSLECEPGPDAEILSSVSRVTWEVTVEVSRNTTEEKIRIALRNRRVVEETKGDTVGSVASLESTNVVLPVLVARIIALKECALLEQREFCWGLADDTDLVSVLHVAADTGKVHNDVNTVRVEFLSRSNTTKLQNLRSVESTTGNNDLTTSVNRPRNAGVFSAGARISTVQALAKEVVDTGGLRCGVGGVEVDLGDQGVEGNVELVLLGAVLVGGSGDLEDKVARGAANIVSVHRKRDLVDELIVVAGLAGIVDVESQNLGTQSATIQHVGSGKYEYLGKASDGVQKTTNQTSAHGGSSSSNKRQNFQILGDEEDWGDTSLQPTAVAVTNNTARQVTVAFKPLEVLAHVTGNPRLVSGQGGNVIPVLLGRKDSDQGVVLSATTKSASSGIENTLSH